MESIIRRLPNSLSCVEESMAGHLGINGVYLKLGKGNAKVAWWMQMESGSRESMLLFSRFF
jgi:hypothetical protein